MFLVLIGGSKKWLGDVLVVCGAILYGMSNVGQEFVVKKFPRSDFLGMISLFGSFISGLQLQVVFLCSLKQFQIIKI